MNWLAHLHLSEPAPEFRLGSLLPDLVPKPEQPLLPALFRPGIDRHRQIDIFTDSHPLFRRSIARMEPPYRRFGGILVDIFYDHYLASRWASYSAFSLPDFVAETYQGFERQWHLVPEITRRRLQQMQTEDWLNSYGDIAGIAKTLERISHRLSRPTALVGAVTTLERHYDGFYEDFAAFYPELQRHVLQRPAAFSSNNLNP